MGKPIVATDADGLLDILERDVTAWIVPRRDAAALAGAIAHAMAHPDERAAMAVRAREAGRQYDIAMFVRKMERLYTMLHAVSRPTKRRGILGEDLSFLATGAGL
jgi:glycosyltransferase involved in cell wall biosynthesis